MSLTNKNITIVSVFRDQEAVLNRFFDQINDFLCVAASMNWHTTLVWAEGDSIDLTRSVLNSYQHNLAAKILVDVSNGSPKYQSIVSQERFNNLNLISNHALNYVPEDQHVVIILDPDLICGVNDLINLILLVIRDNYDIVAPMVYLRRIGWKEHTFYDTFAFRQSGKHFTHNPPYFPNLVNPFSTTIEIDSAGGCLVMRGEVENITYFPAKGEAIVGFCNKARQRGFKIHVDTTVEFFHE